MLRWQKLATLSVLAVLVLLPFALLPAASPRDRVAPAAEPTLNAGERWTATAPGKIEPVAGEYRVGAAAPGRIADVMVEAGNAVSRGDLLVRLDDQELVARVAAAAADVTLKKFIRDAETATARAKRRYDADDAAYAAEQRQVTARMTLDRLTASRRRRDGNNDDVAQARSQVQAAEADASRAHAAAADVRASQGTPDPNANETALIVARSQLAAVQAMLDQTRVRAPIDGTVMSIAARVGEIAAPGAPEPLAIVGDLTQLRVRAELDGRDLGKVRIGQRAVVRADAFNNVEFPGRVTSIAPGLMPGKLSPRGPRRPGEVEVLEIFVMLDGAPPLLPGLKADVYFVDDPSDPNGHKL
jgi:HlyD family secretion protein